MADHHKNNDFLITFRIQMSFMRQQLWFEFPDIFICIPFLNSQCGGDFQVDLTIELLRQGFSFNIDMTGFQNLSTWI